MPDKFDPDERFSLHPLEGEEVIRKLLDPDEPKDDSPTRTKARTPKRRS